MLHAMRYPNGDLSVPFAYEPQEGVIVDGRRRVEKGTDEWEEWVQTLPASLPLVKEEDG